MTKFSASKIVRALLVLEGRDKIVFNDRTTFGRSIKVWGAGEAFYKNAAAMLRDAGYDVSIVTTRWDNMRLHVRA